MFRFKQFTVRQDRCAMKVTTDACILGAWTKVNSDEKILDIGTGTGLLALMLAQKKESDIYAIEIDADAADQAVENIESSPFSKQIKVIQRPVQEFYETGFDLIITNPPFFENQLEAPDAARNTARHTVKLNFETLATIISQKLKPDGRASVLLPPDSMRTFERMMADNEMYVNEKLLIRHTPGGRITREITIFGRIETNKESQCLSIYEEGNKMYSDDFKVLLKAYYLIF
jgi:tRNA1Val (adenine37-N6)-methyltransferase